MFFYVIQSANNLHCKRYFSYSVSHTLSRWFLKRGLPWGGMNNKDGGIMSTKCSIPKSQCQVRATSSPVCQLVEAKSGMQSRWFTQVNVETWHDKCLNLHIATSQQETYFHQVVKCGKQRPAIEVTRPPEGPGVPCQILLSHNFCQASASNIFCRWKCLNHKGEKGNLCKKSCI